MGRDLHLNKKPSQPVNTIHGNAPEAGGGDEDEVCGHCVLNTGGPNGGGGKRRGRGGRPRGPWPGGGVSGVLLRGVGLPAGQAGSVEAMSPAGTC